MRASLLLLALTACSSKKHDAPAAGSGSAPAAPASKLTAVIDGKPVTIAHAFVAALPHDGTYSIYLTTGNGTCRELLDSLYTRGPDDQYALLTAGQRLAGDGTIHSEITDVLRGGKDVKIATGSKFALTGRPAAGTKVDIPIDVDAEVSGEGTLSLHGVASAEACGDRESTPDTLPKGKHPSTATVTVGTTKVALVGARRRSGSIELSTSPLVCGPATAVSNLRIEGSGTSWQARGEWFGLTTVDATNLVVTPGAAGTSEDGPTVSLALSGTGTLGTAPAAFAGTIAALDCPP